MRYLCLVGTVTWIKQYSTYNAKVAISVCMVVCHWHRLRQRVTDKNIGKK